MVVCVLLLAVTIQLSHTHSMFILRCRILLGSGFAKQNANGQ